jgi:hypothetical protein
MQIRVEGEMYNFAENELGEQSVVVYLKYIVIFLEELRNMTKDLI